MNSINKLDFIFMSALTSHFVELNDSVWKKTFYSLKNKESYQIKNIQYLNYFFCNMTHYLQEYRKISYKHYDYQYNLIEYLNYYNVNTFKLESILKQKQISIGDFAYLKHFSQTDLVNDYFKIIKEVHDEKLSEACAYLVAEGRKYQPSSNWDTLDYQQRRIRSRRRSNRRK